MLIDLLIALSVVYLYHVGASVAEASVTTAFAAPGQAVTTTHQLSSVSNTSTTVAKIDDASVDLADDWEAACVALSNLTLTPSSVPVEVVTASKPAASSAPAETLQNSGLYEFVRPDWVHSYEPEVVNTHLLFHPLRSLVAQVKFMYNLTDASDSRTHSSAIDLPSTNASNSTSGMTCEEFNALLKPYTALAPPAAILLDDDDTLPILTPPRTSPATAAAIVGPISNQYIVVNKAYIPSRRLNRSQIHNYEYLYERTKTTSKLAISDSGYYHNSDRLATKQVGIQFQVMSAEAYQDAKLLCAPTYKWTGNTSSVNNILFNLSARWTLLRNILQHDNSSTNISVSGSSVAPRSHIITQLLYNGGVTTGDKLKEIVRLVTTLWSSHMKLNEYFLTNEYNIEENAMILCVALYTLYQLILTYEPPFIPYFRNLIDACLFSPLFGSAALTTFLTHQPTTGTAPAVTGYSVLNTTSRESESAYIMRQYIHTPIEQALVKMRGTTAASNIIGNKYHIRCVEMLNITVEYITSFLPSEERYKHVYWIDSYGISAVLRAHSLYPDGTSDMYSQAAWLNLFGTLPFESPEALEGYVSSVMGIRDALWATLTSK